jgi:FkbM family methyltransferase
VSYRKTMIRVLDRPGGRALLGKIVTWAVQRAGGEGIEIAYLDGLWTRRIGSHFLPDSLRFDYTYTDFGSWKRQAEQYAADTKEYWLQHYCPQEGDVIVDVGAGRGEDTLTFSQAVGKSGRVIAIEAHPLSFAILESFCRLNRLTNVTLLHLALMDKAGTVWMAESESSWMENAIQDGEGKGIEVRASALDEICKAQGVKNIAFLKMNIEGAEQRALLGMESILPGVRQICVACHDFRSEMGHGEQFRTRAFVEQFLTEHGFLCTSRCEDLRSWVRDHIFGFRREDARLILSRVGCELRRD